MTIDKKLSPEDLAVFDAWTEEFWMFIEDKGDALQIWKAATAHTAARCAQIADRTHPQAGAAIRAAFEVE